MALDFNKESKQHLPVATAFYKTYLTSEDLCFEMVESNIAFNKLMEVVGLKVMDNRISRVKNSLNEPLSELLGLFVKSFKSGTECVEEVFFSDVKEWFRVYINPIVDDHLLVTLIDISKEKERIDELSGFLK